MSQEQGPGKPLLMFANVWWISLSRPILNLGGLDHNTPNPLTIYQNARNVPALTLTFSIFSPIGLTPKPTNLSSSPRSILL